MMSPPLPAPSISTPYVPAPAIAAEQATAPVRRYGFAGSDLGMALDDWRELSSANASAACTSSRSAAQVLTCSTAPAPLGGDYEARDLSYSFLYDQLVQISFKTSINGFAYATAILKRRFGEPNQILRNTTRVEDGLMFPHVLMTWRNGRSTIQLSDPDTRGVMLSVRYRLDAASPQLGGDQAAFVRSTKRS